ncbi:hypothetical protein NSMM_910003 [Nitrosomonas mobilis]|uniref:Uncharacterized protein n=1 Tax=Nitrosomonas mobilis TaxID=51642 RepID=A0A1G5SIX1_9PROT|nr:hypothetical protein NSMM_910003 [Nitrosomonas mobilis]
MAVTTAEVTDRKEVLQALRRVPTDTNQNYLNRKSHSFHNQHVASPLFRCLQSSSRRYR